MAVCTATPCSAAGSATAAATGASSSYRQQTSSGQGKDGGRADIEFAPVVRATRPPAIGATLPHRRSASNERQAGVAGDEAAEDKVGTFCPRNWRWD